MSHKITRCSPNGLLFTHQVMAPLLNNAFTVRRQKRQNQQLRFLPRRLHNEIRLLLGINRHAAVCFCLRCSRVAVRAWLCLCVRVFVEGQFFPCVHLCILGRGGGRFPIVPWTPDVGRPLNGTCYFGIISNVYSFY